jgi:hypothetical protein
MHIYFHVRSLTTAEENANIFSNYIDAIVVLVGKELEDEHQQNEELEEWYAPFSFESTCFHTKKKKKLR